MLVHVIVLLESGKYSWDQLNVEENNPVIPTIRGNVNPNIVLRQPMHSSESDTSSQCILPKSKITLKWICPSNDKAGDRMEVIYTKYNKKIDEIEFFSTPGLDKVVSLFQKYKSLNEIEILYILIRNLIREIIHKG